MNKNIFLVSILVWVCQLGGAQTNTIVLTEKKWIDNDFILNLSTDEAWLYKEGHDSTWADPNLNTSDWQHLNPASWPKAMAGKDGRIEGWFRARIHLEDKLLDKHFFFMSYAISASDVYVDGQPFYSFGQTGMHGQSFKAHLEHQNGKSGFLEPRKEYLLAIHVVDYVHPGNPFEFDRIRMSTLSRSINLVSAEYLTFEKESILNIGIIAAILLALALFFWLLYFINAGEKHLLYIAVTATGFAVINLMLVYTIVYDYTAYTYFVLDFLTRSYTLVLLYLFIPVTLAKVFTPTIPKWLWYYGLVLFVLCTVSFFTESIEYWDEIFLGLSFIICSYYIITSWRTLKGSKWAIVIGFLIPISIILGVILIGLVSPEGLKGIGTLLAVALLSFPLSLLVYVSLWIKESQQEVRQNAKAIVQVTEEKKQLLEHQNLVLEQQVNDRTHELQKSLSELKAAQAQLIQSEKLASLGELTAGIAHEIQNPLNFVNNFSELSLDLAHELKAEIHKPEKDWGLIDDLSSDLAMNQEKINHHGKRAVAIVSGMLQHARTGSGQKEATDLNALADEYLRLAYHGMRAKDQQFNVKLETDLDPSVGHLQVIPQDLGRVFLNLINNALYAVRERAKQQEPGYAPEVTLRSRRAEGHVVFTIRDNGTGIPESVKAKIFQPFFTTKPTGQGTGLGLSLAYDIVTKGHGGSLDVETREGEGTAFIIQLPA